MKTLDLIIMDYQLGGLGQDDLCQEVGVLIK